LVDLSVGGFIAADTPPLISDSVLPVTLRVTIGGVDISVGLTALIVYARFTGVGGRFVDLTASQSAFLRYIMTVQARTVGSSGIGPRDAVTEHDGRRPQLTSAGAGSKGRNLWSRWFGLL